MADDGTIVVRSRSYTFASTALPCGVPRDPVTLALAGDPGVVRWVADDQAAWRFHDDPAPPASAPAPDGVPPTQ